jgi:alpha-ketoglutarate-dependent taurine dioxygenase
MGTHFDLKPDPSGTGADVEGLDLRMPPTATVIEALKLAMAEHGVLRFRGQDLNEEHQIAFAASLGTPIGHPEPRVGGKRPPDAKRDEVFYITHAIDEAETEEERRKNAIEAFWHTDLEYMPEPQVYSLLYAVEVPPSGGETEFCNLARAYDALSDELKQRIAGLRAVHWYIRSIPAVTHPLVRVHPLTGKKSLFATPGLTRLVEGMDEAQGKALLAELFEVSTDRRFVWQQVWRNGDAVLWDNRLTMHRRLAMDPNGRRILRRSQTAGEAVIAA